MVPQRSKRRLSREKTDAAGFEVQAQGQGPPEPGSDLPAQSWGFRNVPADGLPAVPQTSSGVGEGAS